MNTKLKELVIKCGATPRYTDRDDIFVIDIEQCQTFGDEYASLMSSVPFGYWHVGDKYELSNFYLEKHDEKCQQCIKLFKANPINQQLRAECDELKITIEKLNELVLAQLKNLSIYAEYIRNLEDSLRSIGKLNLSASYSQKSECDSIAKCLQDALASQPASLK